MPTDITHRQTDIFSIVKIDNTNRCANDAPLPVCYSGTQKDRWKHSHAELLARRNVFPACCAERVKEPNSAYACSANFVGRPHTAPRRYRGLPGNPPSSSTASPMSTFVKYKRRRQARPANNGKTERPMTLTVSCGRGRKAPGAGRPRSTPTYLSGYAGWTRTVTV